MLQYTTTNKSFIKMYYLIKDMGIKNCDFFLQLFDEDLLNVDPHDEENLTELQKAKITNEIVRNPWYYVREVVRISAGGSKIQFELHRGNLALIWAALLDISCFIIWPRQTFKTTSMDVFYSWLYNWGATDANALFFAQEDTIVRKNLGELKLIRDNLPSYLNYYDRRTDKDNDKEMYCKSSNNRFRGKAPSRSEDNASKLGRGFSAQMMWYDEVAFIPYISVMYDSASFAFSTASTLAAKSGSPYHQMMSTTAGYLHTREGMWAYKFMNSCADFSELLYDYDVDQIREYLNNSSTSGFLSLEFMYYDLGKDENYLSEQIKRASTSEHPEDTVDREVLNKWKNVMTDHPLGQRRVAKIDSLAVDPVRHILINDIYMMRLYKDPAEYDFSQVLVGALDCSGNLSGDFSALVVRDPKDFSVIAVMRVNSQSTTLFSAAIASIMEQIFPNMLLVPERNSMGIAIADNVIMFLPNGHKRVYHDPAGKPGIFTNKDVRHLMYSELLRDAVDHYGGTIKDKDILREMKGLMRDRRGRIDHAPGFHDDTLIAYLLGSYFFVHAKNKDQFIDPGLILSKGYNPNAKSVNPEVGAVRQIQGAATMARINSIDDLSDSVNSYFNQRKSDLRGDSSFKMVDGTEEIDPNIDNIEDVKDISRDMNSQDESLLSMFDNSRMTGSTTPFGGVAQTPDDTRGQMKHILGW